ncbi:cell division protein FtsL [Roseovarius sp. SYSU LYC5161]|uniref:cell division protein FtsL n=1 Tax=Roseovarius halophilus (ex Wu et al. 2025) TaxID=3376060 RepID=UPI00399AEA42
MRSFLYVISALSVVALGVWAYQENYRTQEAMREVRALHGQIGAAHERLQMLRAEWAYLNRPDRLRDLAELNFERLRLLPLMPDAFGEVGQIAYPAPALLPITNPVEVASDNAPEAADDDPEEAVQ